MYFLEDFFKFLFLMLLLSVLITLTTIQWTVIDVMSERIDNVLLPQLKQKIEMKLYPSKDNLIFDIHPSKDNLIFDIHIY